MEIHKNTKDSKLSLSQNKYVEKILRKFGMNNMKPVNISLVFHWFSIVRFLEVYVLSNEKKRVICLMYGMLLGRLYIF